MAKRYSAKFKFQVVLELLQDELELRTTSRRVVLETLMLIDQLDDQIKALAQELPLPEELKPRATLLTSMPGVGQLTAATILAEIGDIQRFKPAKSLCNWTGLTPRVHSSDAIVRHGHISKWE